MLILKKKDCCMKLHDGCYMRNIVYATNREQEVVVITEVLVDLLLSPTSVSYESSCPCWLTKSILKKKISDKVYG